MGQNAEDLVDGFTCSWCGVYFEQEHGLPVLCQKCYKEQGKMINAGTYSVKDKLPKAEHKELGT